MVNTFILDYDILRQGKFESEAKWLWQFFIGILNAPLVKKQKFG